MAPAASGVKSASEAGARAIPRLVIAGASSGVGKTTTTIAVARALQARGLAVALFKCGPDYLDPTYHARATGRPSQTLDGWMMGKEGVLSTFARGAAGADVALVEGMMGLFDGASPTSDEGSTAEIARWLGAPVAVVIDAGGMARTIAAVAQGLAGFDPALRVGAVLANRVGGRGHLELLALALGEPALVGGFPLDAAPSFPERHLGLRTATDASVPEAVLEGWGRLAAEWINLDALLNLARSAAPLPAPGARGGAGFERPVACRIGIAWDEAFHFYYEENLRLLESFGATLVRFSPVADRSLPDLDGLYLGGGYPELHAGALAGNRGMLEGIRALARSGAPLYAECGGLMYLSRGIRGTDGVLHPMVGVVDAEAVVHDRLQALGYVEVETQAPTVLGGPGLRFRGHQFRYSELATNSDVRSAYRARRRHGGDAEPEGFVAGDAGNVLASYVHAHWASNPLAARNFVAACGAHRGAR